MSPAAPERPELSVVVPAHNEAESIPLLFDAVKSALDGVVRSFELIIVNDGSTDRTSEVVEQLTVKDSRIKLLELASRVGHQSAITCGLDHAFGDAVIMMDADLQHPSSLLPELIGRWREGFDIVNTRRIDTARTGFLKRLLSRGFYRLFNLFSTLKLQPDSADFRLLSGECVEQLRKLPERQRFYRGLIQWIGFRQSTIDFHCDPRAAGQTSYNIRRSAQLAVSGVVGFTAAGLKLPVVIAGCLLLVTLVYLAISLVLAARGVVELNPGWLSLMTLLLFSMILNALYFGVFGFYLAHLLIEIKGRPPYIVKRSIGIEATRN